MERAQLLKQRGGKGLGYRCRRCGEPKRGHICAARTSDAAAAPEGAVLSSTAAALTELSAQAIGKKTKPSAKASPLLGPAAAPAPPLPVFVFEAPAGAQLGSASSSSSVASSLTSSLVPSAASSVAASVCASPPPSSPPVDAFAAPSASAPLPESASGAAAGAVGTTRLTVPLALPTGQAAAHPTGLAPTPSEELHAITSALAKPAPAEAAVSETAGPEAAQPDPVDEFLSALCNAMAEDDLASAATPFSGTCAAAAAAVAAPQPASGAPPPPVFSQLSLQDAIASFSADPELYGVAAM